MMYIGCTEAISVIAISSRESTRPADRSRRAIGAMAIRLLCTSSAPDIFRLSRSASSLAR